MDKSTQVQPYCPSGGNASLSTSDRNVGVMVFGKDTEVTAAIADAITVMLSEANINAERQQMINTTTSVMAMQTTAMIHHDPLNVLDAVMESCPRLFTAKVYVTNDTIGLGLGKSDYQEEPKHWDIERLDQMGVQFYDTREKYPEKFRPTGAWGAPPPLLPSSMVKRADKMQAVIDGAERKLESAVYKVVKDAIEEVATFAGDDQRPITDNVLAVLANSGSLKAGFVRAIEFGQSMQAVSNDIEDFIRGHRNGSVQPPSITQVFEDGPQSIQIGHRRVSIKPIGQKLDNLISLKIAAIQANLAVDQAEKEAEEAMETLAETMDQLEHINEPEETESDDTAISPEVQVAMFETMVTKRAKESYLDVDVVGLQLIKNIEKQGNPHGWDIPKLLETNERLGKQKNVVIDYVANEQELRERHPELSEESIIAFMGHGGEATVTQFDGKTDGTLLLTNDPGEHEETDGLVSLPPSSKAYIKLEKKMNDGSLSMKDVDKQLKQGEKVVINGVTMARF